MVLFAPNFRHIRETKNLVADVERKNLGEDLITQGSRARIELTFSQG